MIRTVLTDTRDGSRCGGRDTDHPGVIIRPRGNMKVFFFHRLRREAQARERDLYYDEEDALEISADALVRRDGSGKAIRCRPGAKPGVATRSSKILTAGHNPLLLGAAI